MGRILGAMARTLTLELPDDLYQRLEAKASAANMTVASFLLMHLEKMAAVPTPQEMMERLRNLPPVQTTRDPVDVIREIRDGGRPTSS
jgi:predicted DNA-binding protein